MDSFGVYAFSFKAISDSLDDFQLDNVLDTIMLEITDTTFSRDVNSGGNYHGGSGVNIETGVLFTLIHTTKAVSITVGIGDIATVVEAISVYLYDSAF